MQKTTRKNVDIIISMQNRFSAPTEKIIKALKAIDIAAKKTEQKIQATKFFQGHSDKSFLYPQKSTALFESNRKVDLAIQAGAKIANSYGHLIQKLSNPLGRFRQNKEESTNEMAGISYQGPRPADKDDNSYKRRASRGLRNAYAQLNMLGIATYADLGFSLYKGVEFEKAIKKSEAGAGPILQKKTITDEMMETLSLQELEKIKQKNTEIDKNIENIQEEERYQKEINKALRQYRKLIPFTNTDIARDYYATILTSGFSRKKALESEEGILNLAAAGDIPIEKSVETVVVASSQFQKYFKNKFGENYKKISNNIADIIVSSAHMSQATVEDIVAAMGKSGASFSLEEVPFTQAIAGLAAYSAHVKNGDLAGTQWKNVVNTINSIRSGQQGYWVFQLANKEIGKKGYYSPSKIPRGDIAGAIDYIIDILNHLPKKAKNYVTGETADKKTLQGSAIDTWFTDRGENLFKYFFLYGTGELRKFDDLLRVKAVGQAFEKLKTKMEGTQGTVRLLIRDISNVSMAIGSSLLNNKTFTHFAETTHSTLEDVFISIMGVEKRKTRMDAIIDGIKSGFYNAFDFLSNIFGDVAQMFGVDLKDKSYEGSKALGNFIGKILAISLMAVPISLVLNPLLSFFNSLLDLTPTPIAEGIKASVVSGVGAGVIIKLSKYAYDFIKSAYFIPAQNERGVFDTSLPFKNMLVPATEFEDVFHFLQNDIFDRIEEKEKEIKEKKQKSEIKVSFENLPQNAKIEQSYAYNENIDLSIEMTKGPRWIS